MGKVQTSCRGSTKAFLGGGRSSRSVGKTLRGKKRLRPRKVIKEHKRNSGVRTDSRGTVESAPRAGLQTSAKAVSPLRFGHRAHKVGYGKVGKAMRQEKSHLHAVMVGGYLAEGATDFYTTAERRGTAMKKGHIFNQTQPGAKRTPY